MKVSKLTKAMIVMLSGVAFSGVALASDSGSDVNAAMSRIDPDQLSGNGSGTVNADCSDNSGQWDAATASISISTAGGSSKVKIKLANGRPNTHYTVWLRMKGKDRDGASFGGSPITAGGATPLAPTSELDTLVADWVGGGSLVPRANAFISDANGNGKLKVKLDFPMASGSYPFNRMSAAAFADATTKTGGAARAIPNAIADPREAGVTGTPFLIRVVSHCQDDTSFGLSPATREPWFQFP